MPTAEKTHASVPHLTVTTYSVDPKAAGDDMATPTSPAQAHHVEMQGTNPHPHPTSSSSSPTSPDRCDGAGDPFETDVEAMMHPVEGAISSTSGSCPARKSLIMPTQNDTCVWPGKEHWKREAKEAKFNRSCTCLARLNKRNRTIVKVIIVFLVIAIGVGIGVGISRSLNAPIYGDKNYKPKR